MANFELINILQIDATLITGILILLTIGQTRKRVIGGSRLSIPHSVAYVVVPFSLSALGALADSILDLDILYVFSVALMMIGFVYVMITVILLTRERFEPDAEM